MKFKNHANLFIKIRYFNQISYYRNLKYFHSFQIINYNYKSSLINQPFIINQLKLMPKHPLSDKENLFNSTHNHFPKLSIHSSHNGLQNDQNILNQTDQNLAQPDFC